MDLEGEVALHVGGIVRKPEQLQCRDEGKEWKPMRSKRYSGHVACRPCRP